MNNRIFYIPVFLMALLLCISVHCIGEESRYLEFSNNHSFQLKPDSLEDNLKLGRDVDYRRGKADAYLMIAELEKEKGKERGAISYYFSAIYELEILGDSLKLAETNVNIARIFHANSLYIKALEYYASAELIYLSLGLMNENDGLLMNIGAVHYDLQEDFNLALEYYKRAANVQMGNNNEAKSIISTFKMVECYNVLQQYDNALTYNQKILDYYRKTNNWQQEVTALNNMGYTQKNRGRFEEALDYFKQAQELELSKSGSSNPISLVNQAIVFQNQAKNNKALSTLNEAAKLVGKLKDNRLAAEFNHLTSLVYFNLEDFHNSLIHNNASISMGEKEKYSSLLEEAYLLSSKIYQALYNYEEAMISFQHHLLIKDTLQRNQLSAQEALNNIAFRVEQITRETESLWAAEELSYLELQRLKLDSANRQQELEILYQSDSIHRITIQNQQLENQRTRQALLLKEEQIYAAKKGKEVDSLRAKEKIQTLELQTQALRQKEQERQIEFQEKELEINELNLKKVKTRIRWLAAFGVLALFIIYMVIRGLRYAKKTNKILIKQNNEIERQKDEIDYERRQSDKLLLNILPEETAEELKEKGSATPKHYDLVSVLFTDFKGFTLVAEKLTPQQLISELNTCFSAFDKIIDKNNLEKIKTIGDAYMCAGGIPVANTTNPVDIVKAGLEIKDYMDRLKAEREAKGEDFWELRIGIHTGQVVAGVVGKNKFAYDIWGDAVNTASRMESSGIPGKVNISGETYKIIKDQFNCTYRGKIKAKNKGEIDMYIVEEEMLNN